MGNVELDGSIGGVTAAYGVIGYDDNSAITFLQRQGSRGVVYPTQPYPVHRSEATTSGTFTVLWGGH